MGKEENREGVGVTCVKQRIVGKEENREGVGGGGGKIVILSTSTSTQIPNQTHKQTTQ